MKTIKKVICIVMLLVASLPTASQSLRDYIRSISSSSDTDSLVLQAVSPALSLIREQYRLERNGSFFGKKNRPYYGETYSLGIKISGGTILQRTVIYPWENDKDFQRVNDGEKYVPVHFRTMQRSLMDKDWKSVEFEIQTQCTAALTLDSLLYHHEDITADFGLSLNTEFGKKRGYLIWAYSTTNIQDSLQDVKLQMTNLQIEVKADSTLFVALSPEKTENLLGGLFVIPQVERPGYIKIQLSGVVVRKNDNSWILELASSFNPKHAVKTIEPVPLETDKQKRKKKKKDKTVSENNQTENLEPTPVN